MDGVEYVAAYGAVVATFTLLWNIYTTWIGSKPSIDISYDIDCSKDNESVAIIVHVTNTGFRDVTVREIWIGDKNLKFSSVHDLLPSTLKPSEIKTFVQRVEKFTMEYFAENNTKATHITVMDSSFRQWCCKIEKEAFKSLVFLHCAQFVAKGDS